MPRINSVDYCTSILGMCNGSYQGWRRLFHFHIRYVCIMVYATDNPTDIEESALGAEEKDTGLQGKGKHQKRWKKG